MTCIIASVPSSSLRRMFASMKIGSFTFRLGPQRRQEGLRLGRVVEHEVSKPLPAGEGLLLLRGVEGVDHHAVDVPTHLPTCR